MTLQLESSIVRIFSTNDQIVGTGFLIGERHALTCAHVVASALELREAPTDPPQAQVRLDLPLVAPGDMLQAQIIIWKPEVDVAGLELIGDLPTGAKVARLFKVDQLWEHSFRAFGFPQGYNDGVWASGLLRGRTAAGWLQIEDKNNTGYFVVPGFSGGPVWDDKLAGVVGMIVAADTGKGVRAAFSIPTARLMDALRETWQEGLWPMPTLAETLPSTVSLPSFSQANFVGRRSAMDELKAQLASGQLVRLVGLGGIGKSELAIAVAHELATEGSFSDGIFWVDGRKQTTLGAILTELISLLGLDLSQETLSTQQRIVISYLSGLDTLVILDNLETVAEQQIVVSFLHRLPCPVLVTSRIRPARSTHERIIQVESLPQDAAIRLFQQNSGLALEEPTKIVVDLCTVDLEGHPLALKIVGALVADGLDVEDLQRQLKKMPKSILSEPETAGSGSVADALQLSYQRLDPLAQTLLARMSIFGADFDLAALYALSPEHPHLDQFSGLRKLLTRSLIAQHSRQRYRLHSVTRQFAYTLLDEPPLYHRRASEYFMTEAGNDSLAATEHLFLAGDVAQAAGLVPIYVDEWCNAGQASRAVRLVEQFKPEELARETWLVLCETQGDLLMLLGQNDEARDAYQTVLSDAGSPERLARVKRKIGELIKRQRPSEAIPWFEQALTHLDDPECLEAARVYIRMSSAWFHQGEYDRALEWGQRGLDIVQRMDERLEIVSANINLGSIYERQGSYDRSIAAYERAFELVKGEEPRRLAMESVVGSNLALVYHSLGKWQDSIAYYEQSLRTEERIGNLDGIAITCFNLGNAYTLIGELDRAEENLDRCLALWKRVGSDYGVAATYMNFGLLCLRQGDLSRAEATLAQSQAAFEAVGSDDFMPEVYRLMSEVALAQDQVPLAVEYAQRSLALARGLGARMEEGATQRALGVALIAQGQTETALEALNSSLDLLTELGSLYEAARTHYEMGLLYFGRDIVGDQKRAVTHLRQSLETFSRLGAARDIERARAALIRVGVSDQTE